MRRELAPLLFDDEEKQLAEAKRVTVVAPAVRSDVARYKARMKRTKEGQPVHSFSTLLMDLATLAKNWVIVKTKGGPSFPMYTVTSILEKSL